MIIKPKKLNIGDKVAIIAPSSPATEEVVKKGEKMIKAMGLEPVMYPSCYTTQRDLPISDYLKAKDINDAFQDRSIKGIICLKAGYGIQHILKLLDYDLIKENPKIFLGYSDITALHIVLNKICRMVTYHGSMASSNIYKKKGDKFKFDPYTFASIKKNLFTNEAPGLIENPPGEIIDSLFGGKAEESL
ncbi:S66 peptidase family protein [Clostridium sp. Marseille-QA1073]